MFMLLMYLFWIMFFSGCMVFMSNLKHLLLMLLSLEFLVLSLFFFLMIYLNSFFFEVYFSLFYLIYSVCEGALGLSLLVSLIRTHGNDYFQSFSIL